MANQIAIKYLRLLKPYTPLQIRTQIFSNYLETQNDGVIEFYEFIEIMCIIEQYPNKSLADLMYIIKEIKTGQVCDPKNPNFGKQSKLKTPVMPENRRAEYKQAFKFLDSVSETDGVINVNEIITALKITNGLKLI
jgi:Ca2+-binding EF-hand superfamily protein